MASENNKRIAKNTMFLYFRMLLVMGVSLFTVRIVLKVLGVEDYGIYNVVAGIVSMFGFLSGTMASASQRFFAFEIGKKDFVKLKQTFSMTVTIYAMLAILIIILAETVGLWFLNNKMTIPPDRMEAARWVYHFAIASFIVTIMAIPYNAAIISKENMKVFAYISIIEVSLKLGIVYMLTLFDADKLKLYAVLMFIAQVIIRFSYSLYCRRTYTEFRYSFYWDRGLFQTLVGYSGWNLIGSLAVLFRDHGINLLLNLFFNPVVNAARGIAFQISQALLLFTNNFYTAVKPQIIKSYASSEKEITKKLVFQSSKIGFFLMLLLTIPILFETKYILNLWLIEVPEFAIIFTKLIIINILIDVMNIPIVTAIQATGNIKKYQLIVSIILLLNLPISYLFLKNEYQPEVVFFISILLSIICYIPRLFLFTKTTKIPYISFLKQVLLLSIVIFTIAIGFNLIINNYFEEGFFRLIITLASELFIILPIIYLIGITKQEKLFIKNFFKKI